MEVVIPWYSNALKLIKFGTHFDRKIWSQYLSRGELELVLLIDDLVLLASPGTNKDKYQGTTVPVPEVMWSSSSWWVYRETPSTSLTADDFRSPSRPRCAQPICHSSYILHFFVDLGIQPSASCMLGKHLSLSHVLAELSFFKSVLMVKAKLTSFKPLNRAWTTSTTPSMSPNVYPSQGGSPVWCSVLGKGAWGSGHTQEEGKSVRRLKARSGSPR